MAELYAPHSVHMAERFARKSDWRAIGRNAAFAHPGMVRDLISPRPLKKSKPSRKASKTYSANLSGEKACVRRRIGLASGMSTVAGSRLGRCRRFGGGCIAMRNRPVMQAVLPQAERTAAVAPVVCKCPPPPPRNGTRQPPFPDLRRQRRRPLSIPACGACRVGGCAGRGADHHHLRHRQLRRHPGQLRCRRQPQRRSGHRLARPAGGRGGHRRVHRSIEQSHRHKRTHRRVRFAPLATFKHGLFASANALRRPSAKGAPPQGRQQVTRETISVSRRLKKNAADKGLTDKPKRPWRKPRLLLVEFNKTQGSFQYGPSWDNESATLPGYDPNVS